MIDSECGAGRLTKVGRGGGSYIYIYHLVYTKVLRDGLELDSFRHAHMPPPESQTMGSKLKQHPSTPCSEEEEERVTIEDGWRWQRGKETWRKSALRGACR